MLRSRFKFICSSFTPRERPPFRRVNVPLRAYPVEFVQVESRPVSAGLRCRCRCLVAVVPLRVLTICLKFVYTYLHSIIFPEKLLLVTGNLVAKQMQGHPL